MRYLALVHHRKHDVWGPDTFLPSLERARAYAASLAESCTSHDRIDIIEAPDDTPEGSLRDWACDLRDDGRAGLFYPVPAGCSIVASIPMHGPQRRPGRRARA